MSDFKYSFDMDENLVTQIDSFIPTPSANDYARGYIRRYVVQHAGNNSIYEVSVDTYSSIPNRGYNKATINWYISGPKNNVIISNIIETYGVSELNTFELKKASNTIIDINRFFQNVLQFWKTN